MRSLNEKLKEAGFALEVYLDDFPTIVGREALTFRCLNDGGDFTISVEELAIVCKFLKLTEEI